jgi:hypothetical protein
MNIMADVSTRPFTLIQSRAETSFGCTLFGATNDAMIGITTVDVAIKV